MAKTLLDERSEQFENTTEMIRDLISIMTRAEEPAALEESIRVVGTVRNKASKGREEYRDACERETLPL